MKSITRLFLLASIILTAFVVYNLAFAQSNTWTTKAPISSARQQLAAGEVGGVLYAVGGWNVCTPSARLEAYDPVANTWSQRAPMPTARGYLSAGVLNGQLYTVGGSVGCGANVATVEAYDPVSNSWTTKAPLPAPRAISGVGVVNGILYVVGGIDANGNSQA